MFIRTFGFVLCLLLILGSLFGLYRLQAQTPIAPIPQPTGEGVAPRSVGSASPPRSDVQSDFTQNIIEKTLFAPLGTELNQTPVSDANVKLIATFTQKDPTDARAIVLNTATGEQKPSFLN